jgi:hypothetical protein
LDFQASRQRQPARNARSWRDITGAAGPKGSRNNPYSAEANAGMTLEQLAALAKIWLAAGSQPYGMLAR